MFNLAGFLQFFDYKAKKNHTCIHYIIFKIYNLNKIDSFVVQSGRSGKNQNR